MMAESTPLHRLTGFELVGELKRRYERGATIRELADDAHRPYGTIRNMLARSGVVFRKCGSRPGVDLDGADMSSPRTSHRRSVSAEADALGQALRTLRVQQGLTLAVVAERTRMDVSTICNFELAVRVPQRVTVLWSLLDTCGVTDSGERARIGKLYLAAVQKQQRKRRAMLMPGGW